MEAPKRKGKQGDREAVREKVDGENSENCPLQQNISMPHTRSVFTNKKGMPRGKKPLSQVSFSHGHNEIHFLQITFNERDQVIVCQKRKARTIFFANQSALIFCRDQYNQILRRTSVEME